MIRPPEVPKPRTRLFPCCQDTPRQMSIRVLNPESLTPNFYYDSPPPPPLLSPLPLRRSDSPSSSLNKGSLLFHMGFSLLGGLLGVPAIWALEQAGRKLKLNAIGGAPLSLTGNTHRRLKGLGKTSSSKADPRRSCARQPVSLECTPQAEHLWMKPSLEPFTLLNLLALALTHTPAHSRGPTNCTVAHTCLQKQRDNAYDTSHKNKAVCRLHSCPTNVH